MLEKNLFLGSLVKLFELKTAKPLAGKIYLPDIINNIFQKYHGTRNA